MKGVDGRALMYGLGCNWFEKKSKPQPAQKAPQASLLKRMRALGEICFPGTCAALGSCRERLRDEVHTYLMETREEAMIPLARETGRRWSREEGIFERIMQGGSITDEAIILYERAKAEGFSPVLAQEIVRAAILEPLFAEMENGSRFGRSGCKP